MKTLLIASLMITAALAAGQGFNMPSFAEYDTNGDGKISEAELNDGRAKRHEKFAKEGRMLRNAQNAATFAEIDANGDGMISKEEFAAHQKAMRSK